MSNVRFYDFDQPDAEDSIPSKGGVIVRGTDRSSLGSSLLLVGVALGGLQVLARALGPDAILLSIALVVSFSIFPEARKLAPTTSGSARQFARLLRESLHQFVWQRFLSLCAVVSAFALLLGKKDRYLPLQVPIAAFATTFLSLFWIDVQPQHVLQFVLGSRLAALAQMISVLGTYSHLLGAIHPYGVAIVASLLSIPILLLLHVVCLTAAGFAAAVIVTWAATPFARSMEDAKIVIDDSSGFAHISDLHFTAKGNSPIEDCKVTDEELKRSVLDAMPKSKSVLVISGDITDSGGRGEWLSFLETVESSNPADRGLIILAPGNHDLFPYMASFNPLFSSLPMGSRLVRLRKIRYLQAVLRVCPEMTVQVDGREQSLSEYLSDSTPLFQACAQQTADVDLGKIDAIWDSCFPMYCVVECRAYVCLDTNRPTSNFTTAAFGQVSPGQTKRVEALLERLYDRHMLRVVMVGHHHLFTPLKSRRKGWKSKHLEIVAGGRIFSIARYAVDYYLHGHRHVPFGIKFDDFKVISAGSPRFPEHADT